MITKEQLQGLILQVGAIRDVVHKVKLDLEDMYDVLAEEEEEKEEFLLGDLVRFVEDVEDADAAPPIGSIGVIRHINPGHGLRYGVEFADYDWGHSLGGRLLNEHGWFVGAEGLERV